MVALLDDGTVLTLGSLGLYVAGSWAFGSRTRYTGSMGRFPVSAGRRRLLRATATELRSAGFTEEAEALEESAQGLASISPESVVEVLLEMRREDRRGLRGKETIRAFDAATERLRTLASQLRATG